MEATRAGYPWSRRILGVTPGLVVCFDGESIVATIATAASAKTTTAMTKDGAEIVGTAHSICLCGSPNSSGVR